MAKKEKAVTAVPNDSGAPVEVDEMAKALLDHAAAQAKEKRDFFAISAASGILAHHGTGIDAAGLAKHAYQVADALLAASNS